MFLSRMQVNTATDMTVMFTPTNTYNDETEPRVFRIYFPEAEGAWCLQDETSFTTVEGVGSSPVDQGAWEIDEELPGTLTATCYQGSSGGNDYIEVTGIDDLTGGTSYGFRIVEQVATFSTGSNSGDNLISFQLEEGDSVENISFGINLLGDDRVIVDVEVLDIDTITCSLSTNTVNLGSLFPGGVYVTGDMSLNTESGVGFYWAVYGQGDGSDAGLYLDETPGHLLSSEGADGSVNLVTGEGFGMLASSDQGYVPVKYANSTSGIFGSISHGVQGASVFLYGDIPTGVVNTSITYGARAGIESISGSYEETLTYVCGGYIGATEESGGIEEMVLNTDLCEQGDCSACQIGEECGGGIVAYHDGEGGGLIAASEDFTIGEQETFQWGCFGQSVGNTSSGYGEGLDNTNSIVDFHDDIANFNDEDYYTFEGDYGTIGCNSNNTGEVAAKFAKDYDGGGHDDWFLPSRAELHHLRDNFDAIAGLVDDRYWTSEEVSENEAYEVLMDPDDFTLPMLYTKDNSFRVRFVRFF